MKPLEPDRELDARLRAAFEVEPQAVERLTLSALRGKLSAGPRRAPRIVVWTASGAAALVAVAALIVMLRLPAPAESPPAAKLLLANRGNIFVVRGAGRAVVISNGRDRREPAIVGNLLLITRGDRP